MGEVLGDTFDGEKVEKLVAEADQVKDGRISYKEFVAFIKGERLGADGDKVIDAQLTKDEAVAMKPVKTTCTGRTCLEMPRTCHRHVTKPEGHVSATPQAQDGARCG